MSSTPFKPLEPDFSVAAQIVPTDLADAAAQGFTCVVNNRPDDEQPGQPTGETIAAAAEAAGLEYIAIPVDHRGFSPEQVDALRRLLDAQAREGSGRILAFCRSGTRSTMLWALAQAARGVDYDQLATAAAAEGYDLKPLQPLMAQLRQIND